MQRQTIPYQQLILVCGNVREDGRRSCGPSGGSDLKDQLKAKCKELNLPVRVVQTGCLGQCEQGPTVMLSPGNVWLSEVKLADIDEIVNLIRDLLV